MKNNKIDRLFQNKLDKHELEPSAQAWQQLENQLHQKKERKTWIYFSSIAASLLLLFGIWAAIEYSASTLPVDSVGLDEKPAVETPVTPPQPTISRQVPDPGQPEAPLARHENKDSKAIEKTDNKPSGLKEKKKQQEPSLLKKESEPKSSGALAEKRPREQEEQPLILKSAEGKSFKATLPETDLPTAPPLIDQEPSESIVILYKADEAEQEENSTGSNPTVDRTTLDGNEKEHPGRKVIGFLKKVKRNSTGNLAELREAKDDLLSFRIGKEN